MLEMNSTIVFMTQARADPKPRLLAAAVFHAGSSAIAPGSHATGASTSTTLILGFRIVVPGILHPRTGTGATSPFTTWPATGATMIFGFRGVG